MTMTFLHNNAHVIPHGFTSMSGCTEGRTHTRTDALTRLWSVYRGNWQTSSPTDTLPRHPLQPNHLRPGVIQHSKWRKTDVNSLKCTKNLHLKWHWMKTAINFLETLSDTKRNKVHLLKSQILLSIQNIIRFRRWKPQYLWIFITWRLIFWNHPQKKSFPQKNTAVH